MSERFIKSFEVRWSDIDANVHLIHTAYSGFMADMRMWSMDKVGINMQAIGAAKIGPVLLNENIHFIKEVRPMETVWVDIELSGMTEDFKLLQFHHGLYKSDGSIAAFSKILFGFIDMKTRKMTSIPDAWKDSFSQLPKADSFEWLQKDQIKNKDVPWNKKIDLEG